jgi:hypothetical protein
MIDLGTVKPGSTIYIPFATFAGATGAPITMTGLAAGDIKIFKDGGTTERASTSGFTLLDTDGIDFSNETGIHGISISLADNTTSGFYTAGSRYFVVIGDVTVDSQTLRFVAATFTIGYEGAILDTTIATLASQTSFTLTAGSADNNAYVGCPVLIHDIASAVQVEVGYCSAYTGSTKTVTLAADPGVFTVAAGDNISVMMPANVRAFGGLTVTGRDIGASVLLSSGTGTGQVSLTSGAVLLQATQTGVTIPTVTTLTNLPAITSNWLTAAGIAASALNGKGDWNVGKTGYTLTATTGLGNQTANITGNLSGSVGSVTGAVGSVSGNVGGSVASVTGNVGGAVASVTGNVGGSVGSVTGAVGSVTGAVGSVAGNVGGNVVGSVGSLATQAKADVNAEVDTALADIHLDHLLATDYDPASKPGTATALLNELVESDVGVSRFSANALEQAPSGGGAVADWTADERTALRAILGIPASGTTPADPTAGILDTIRDTIGVAGAGLTAIPWNAAWDAEVQSEATDALNAYDPPTNTEMVAAFTQIKGATWATTDTLEAIRDRGDAAWITATGFSTLDAAGVRAAVGLASANLDTQIGTLATSAALATVDTVVDSILLLAGTNGVVVAAGSKAGYSLAAAGLDQVVIEAGMNARQAMAITSAGIAGVLSGAATTTVVIKGAGVATTRITATVDADGNRSEVTLALPS